MFRGASGDAIPFMLPSIPLDLLSNSALWM